MSVEHLILQIAVILMVTRVGGATLRWLGQPEAIGEIIGGLLLGPSVLGLIAHGAVLQWLFPARGSPSLNLLAELGVMFFMFIVGLELDPLSLRGQGKAVIATGLTSLLGSFAGALVLAWVLVQRGALRGSPGASVACILMSATAMAMTAFPVLARLINDQNLQKTAVGRFTIAAAAVLDMAGWCLLAVVYDMARAQISGHGGSAAGALWVGVKTAVLATAYVVVMMFFVRRFLWRFQAHFEVHAQITRNTLALTLLLVLASGLAAQTTGINPIFGAFMMGLIFPSDENFVHNITAKLEDITLLLLMPIFFATIGLHTNLARLHSAAIWQSWAWLVGGLFFLKFFSTTIAAKATGVRWADTGLVGLLMNTHGVVELVVLGLAYDMHAINSQTLALLILALLAITVGASGLVRLIFIPLRRRERRASLAAGATETQKTRRHILVPLVNAATAAALVRTAATLLGGELGRISAVRLREPSEWHLGRGTFAAGEPEVLDVARREGDSLKIQLDTVSFSSRRIARDICRLAAYQHADWIVLGSHHGILDTSALGGIVARVLRKAPCPVAILIGQKMPPVRQVLVPYLGEPQDAGALLAAQHISRHAGVQVTILHVVKPHRPPVESPLGVKELANRLMPAAAGANPVRMQVLESDSPAAVVAEKSRDYDLIILGVSPQWKLHEQLLGRAQISVVRQCACPTLVVQTPAQRGRAAKWRASLWA
jgi:Kef-type K+ transport system membrane component KefB/nucleotide-binding universal stress UspA family protein